MYTNSAIESSNKAIVWPVPALKHFHHVQIRHLFRAYANVMSLLTPTTRLVLATFEAQRRLDAGLFFTVEQRDDACEGTVLGESVGFLTLSL